MRRLIMVFAAVCLVGCSTTHRLSEQRQDDFDKHMLRGESHLQLHGFADARREFDKALKISPASERAYLLRAISYFHQGDYAPCIKDLREAESLDPTDFYVFKWRGAAHHQLKQSALALSYYKKALSLAPPIDEQVDILFAMGSPYTRSGRLEECVRVWEKAARLAPDNQQLKRYLVLAKRQISATQ